MILLTPFFIFLIPFIYFVKFNEVPMLHPEFFALLGSIVIVSLLSSLALYRASWVRLSLALSILIVFSLSFLPEFQSGVPLKIAFFLVLVLAIQLREKTLPFFCMIAGICCMATLVFSVGHQFNAVTISEKPVNSNPDLPPYIHIIFDEYMGVDAIPTNIGQGQALQNEIKTLFPAYGFRLFTHAYSRYSRTYDSIPNLLNFTPKSQDGYYFPGGFSKQILTENKDFELISKMGYKIRVYQPDYIDFCHAKGADYSYCYTYPVYSFKAFYHLNFPWTARYPYLLKSYLLSSFIYQNALYDYVYTIRPLAAKIKIYLPDYPWDQNQLSSLNTLVALEQLKEDVIQHSNDGSAFFAHILLPHSPYIYDENCQIHSNPMDWLINYDFGPQGNTPERRVLRYQLYENQLQCLSKSLKTVLDTWQTTGVMKNAIIIIQGDHSSRLPVISPTIENEGVCSWQDFNDAYPALFAIKAPFYFAGLDNARYSLTYLFGQVSEQISHTQFPIDNNNDFVYLTDAVPGLRVNQVIEPLSAFIAAS
ncbi:MAG: hypothetical protein HKM04_08440 [Legionellales bacterium]|nr:hypothetical protein [Legionellales bacterium]